MRVSGFSEAEHHPVQVWLAQPLRGQPPEDAVFAGPLADIVERTALPVRR